MTSALIGDFLFPLPSEICPDLLTNGTRPSCWYLLIFSLLLHPTPPPSPPSNWQRWCLVQNSLNQGFLQLTWQSASQPQLSLWRNLTKCKQNLTENWCILSWRGIDRIGLQQNYYFSSWRIQVWNATILHQQFSRNDDSWQHCTGSYWQGQLPQTFLVSQVPTTSASQFGFLANFAKK